MEKLVSIIIPVYNVETWIGKCLASVMKQTYNHLEILVIDDGSTDRTGEICDKMACLDDRVVVMHQENSGVSEARNIGIREAKGNYLCFVDGDDFICEKYVEELYRKMEQTQAGMAVCGYVEIQENGVEKRTLENQEAVKNSREVLELIFFHDEVGRSLWNKMLDKRVIDAAGIWFSKEFLIGEDMLFLIKYLKEIQTVAFTDKRCYYYLWRERSAMQRKQWDESYYKSRVSWICALDASEYLLKDEASCCRRRFMHYKLLVYYRILCESVSLKNNDSEKRVLERDLKKYVRKYGIQTIISGELGKETAIGVLLCLVSPEVQVLLAKMRRH